MQVQNNNLTGYGEGTEKNRGAIDIFGKGDKIVITLTTADHDCVQACILASSKCHL